MAVKKKKEVDPPRQLLDLQSGLRDRAPGRLYVVRGEERYFRERAIELIRQRAEKCGWEVSSHTGNERHPDYDLSLLLGDLSAGSLFSAARCVIVRDAAPLLKKAGKLDSAFVRAAKAFLDCGDEEGCLILAADSIRADNALVKAVPKSGGALVSCRKLWDSPPHWNPDPRQSELVQWLVKRSHELKLPVNSEQALYIAAAVGNDLFALEAQLEKIAVTKGRALREVVGWSTGGSPFKVADDLVSGNLAGAVSGIEVLFRGGFHGRDGKRLVDQVGLSAILLGGLLGQVRQAVAGSRALDDPVAAAARAGWNLPPMRRAEFAQRVQSRTQAEWSAMLEDVARLEQESRSGKALDANDFCLLALKWIPG